MEAAKRKKEKSKEQTIRMEQMGWNMIDIKVKLI